MQPLNFCQVASGDVKLISWCVLWYFMIVHERNTACLPIVHRALSIFRLSLFSLGYPAGASAEERASNSASLTSKCFCVLVTANSYGFRVSLLVVWVRFCFNYSSFLCPFSPTFIPLSVQEIIKKIGSLNPWTSIIDFSFPGNHDQCRKNS